MNQRQFSISTLLALSLLCAVSLALSRFDSLWIPIAFPFTIGPIVAYRVTRTSSSIVIGILSSIFWSLVAIVPIGILGWLAVWSFAGIDERLATRSLLVAATLTYFLAASILGGYIGGIVAKTD